MVLLRIAYDRFQSITHKQRLWNFMSDIAKLHIQLGYELNPIYKFRTKPSLYLKPGKLSIYIYVYIFRTQDVENL